MKEDMTLIGFCGDNCALCPRYIATKTGDIHALKKALDLWVRVGWRDKETNPEEVACNGCITVKSCRYDNVRICAKNKGITNCGECIDYPCQEIIKVFERTKSYERICKEVCSPGEYERLHKAFFLKKQTLDAIHHRRKQ
jgi:hypothetical protein